MFWIYILHLQKQSFFYIYTHTNLRFHHENNFFIQPNNNMNQGYEKNESLVDYIVKIKDTDHGRILLSSFAKWLGLDDYTKFDNNKLVEKIKETENSKSFAIGLYLMRQPFFYWIKDTDTVSSFVNNVMLKEGVCKLEESQHIKCVVWIRFSSSKAKTITVSMLFREHKNVKHTHHRIRVLSEGFIIEGSRKKHLLFMEAFEYLLRKRGFDITQNHIFYNVNNYPDLNASLEYYVRNNTLYCYKEQENIGLNICQVHTPKWDAYTPEYERI